MENIKLVIAGIFILAGIVVLISGVIGIFRIRYVLNRLHAAAMLDSLGLFLITIGMVVINGFSFDSLKLFMVVVLFWVASPVCSHLLAALETSTNPELEKDCEIMQADEYERFKTERKTDQ